MMVSSAFRCFSNPLAKSHFNEIANVAARLTFSIK